MKRETYFFKCNGFLALSQCKKEEANLLINEEKKFREKILRMKKSNLISEEFYNKVKPVSPQPARFFGPAKVRKKKTPPRPIVAMPGSRCRAVMAEWEIYQGKLP